MVHAVQIPAMLPGVIETLLRNLRELAASEEARGREGVCWRDVPVPVCMGRLIGLGCQSLSVEEEALVVTVPPVRLYWERIAGIGGSLMMTMDLPRLDIALQASACFGLTISTYLSL